MLLLRERGPRLSFLSPTRTFLLLCCRGQRLPVIVIIITALREGQGRHQEAGTAAAGRLSTDTSGSLCCLPAPWPMPLMPWPGWGWPWPVRSCRGAMWSLLSSGSVPPPEQGPAHPGCSPARTLPAGPCPRRGPPHTGAGLGDAAPFTAAPMARRGQGRGQGHGSSGWEEGSLLVFVQDCPSTVSPPRHHSRAQEPVPLGASTTGSHRNPLYGAGAPGPSPGGAGDRRG